MATRCSACLTPRAPSRSTATRTTPAGSRPPGPARTGDFLLKSGKPARPYSEARLVWSGDYLYLALYASDEDIESHTDQPDQPIRRSTTPSASSFSQPGVEYAIDVTPKAVITDSIRRGGGEWDYTWNSGAHASREIDGSINEPKNMDEEWAIELAIPFESLGMKGERGENIGMSISRCDTPKRVPESARAGATAPPTTAGGGSSWSERRPGSPLREQRRGHVDARLIAERREPIPSLLGQRMRAHGVLLGRRER